MNNNSQSGLPAQAGLIKLIILIIVVVIILSYLGINIQKIAESETGRANFGYVWQIILKGWDWLMVLYQQYLAGLIDQVFGGVINSVKNVVK